MVSLLVPFLLASPSEVRVPITRFGVEPGQSADAGPGVRKAVAFLKENPGTTLVFPKGDYRFGIAESTPHTLFLSNSDVENPRNVAVALVGLKNVRLEGEGARFLFKGRILPFLIQDCTNVELKGFEIDWPRPLMSQGEVVESGPDGLTLRIDSKQYPYVVEDNALKFVVEGEKKPVWGYMEFDPKTGGVAYGTGDAGCLHGDWDNLKVVEKEPGLVRFDAPLTKFPKVGNALVARHGVRDHAGTFIENSHNVTLRQIDYRHTSGLGVLAQYSSNLTYRNVEFRPTKESGRLFTGHDDGFHFSNCKGRIVVEDCCFFGLMDDPINIHGTSVPVMQKLDDRSLRVRFGHGQSKGLRFGQKGDRVSFLDRGSLLSTGQGTIREIKTVDLDTLDLVFEGPVPKGVGSETALENLTWTPEVQIRRTVFTGVRARGLLLSTPRKSVIENCIFKSSGSAILIAGDANGWYESGAVNDVTIRRNRFENCLTSTYQFCNAVISIAPEIPKPGDKPFHRNIRIEDNTFVMFDKPLLWALSAGNVRFVRNDVQRSRDFEPWHRNEYGLRFLHCERVVVQDNDLSVGYEGRKVRIEGGKPETIRIFGWE